MLRKVMILASLAMTLSTAASAQAQSDHGTAAEARAMLGKAVAAVKTDQTKALDSSTREKADSWTETFIHFASKSVTG